MLFPWLFFIHFKIINNPYYLIVLYKIRHVYSTIHQLWSNSHQIVKIFVIINHLFFHTALSIHPIFKSARQILSTYIFLNSEYFSSCWYSAAQQRLIFKVHIFHFPNRFGEIFYLIWYCFKCELVFLAWNFFSLINHSSLWGKYLFLR